MKEHGFTLIEVMIVVAIVSILAAVAYPSYQDYLTRGVRSEAAAMLLDVANRQEQYYLDFHTYASDMTALGYTADSEHYNVSVKSADADGFVLSAVAINVQAKRDTDCPSLEINQLGMRTSDGKETDVKECWP